MINLGRELFLAEDFLLWYIYIIAENLKLRLKTGDPFVVNMDRHTLKNVNKRIARGGGDSFINEKCWQKDRQKVPGRLA